MMFPLYPRQEQRKGRALALLAFHRQISVISEGIGASTPKTKARTAFRGVKQVKDFGEALLRNTSPCIDHIQGYKATSIASFQGDLTTFRHSINGISYKIT